MGTIIMVARPFRPPTECLSNTGPCFNCILPPLPTRALVMETVSSRSKPRMYTAETKAVASISESLLTAMSATIALISASASFTPSIFFLMKPTLCGWGTTRTSTMSRSQWSLKPSRDAETSRKIPISPALTMVWVVSTTVTTALPVSGFLISMRSRGRMPSCLASCSSRSATSLPASKSRHLVFSLWTYCSGIPTYNVLPVFNPLQHPCHQPGRLFLDHQFAGVRAAGPCDFRQHFRDLAAALQHPDDLSLDAGHGELVQGSRLASNDYHGVRGPDDGAVAADQAHAREHDYVEALCGLAIGLHVFLLAGGRGDAQHEPAPLFGSLHGLVREARGRAGNQHTVAGGNLAAPLPRQLLRLLRPVHGRAPHRHFGLHLLAAHSPAPSIRTVKEPLRNPTCLLE